MENAPIDLAILMVAGIAAQWFAWRMQLPSILLLLLTGFVAGVWIDANALFGQLLVPFVSFSVALILFEGGLELRMRELRDVGQAVFRLVTLGIAVTWILAAAAAHYTLGMNWNTAVLIGAILVVTGPTVVGPLLRQIQPAGQSGPTLKWEAILNDAIGAVLAVLVFEAILVGQIESAPLFIAFGVLKTLLVGLSLGSVAAFTLVYLLRKFIIPEQLHVAVTLGTVIGGFALSNVLQPESGLLTVTVMGIVVANQRYVNVRHLVEFKENLRVLLLALMFVVLATRVELRQITDLGWGAAVFVVFLVLIARPLVVAICTFRTKLTWVDRVYVAMIAPRGIVAASVASVFALRMRAEGIEQAELVIPAIFLVITATVTFYGLLARPLARRLGLAKAGRQGVVIVGASLLPRQIALALEKEGVPTILIDINRRYVRASRLAGLNARQGDALSEDLVNELDLQEMGRMLALTANDQVNSLAALHFAQVFGREEVYQMRPDASETAADEVAGLPRHLRGRVLFGPKITHATLNTRLNQGGTVKTTKLTKEFDYDDYVREYGDHATPLFIVMDGRLRINAEGVNFHPQPGSKLISIVDAEVAREHRVVAVGEAREMDRG